MTTDPESDREAVKKAVRRWARSFGSKDVEGLADLAAYRCDLAAVVAGEAPSPRWQSVFFALSQAMSHHALPVRLLSDLLDAFEQDVVQQRYADRGELLDYCRRSANPVGRLLLHLYGIGDKQSLTTIHKHRTKVRCEWFLQSS